MWCRCKYILQCARELFVCTPKDAYYCFMRTEMDVLVLENCILYEEDQPEFQEGVDWKMLYELD